MKHFDRCTIGIICVIFITVKYRNIPYNLIKVDKNVII